MKSDKKLKFTFLITERNLGVKITAYLKNHGIDKNFLFYAKGSASSALLDYLGIGESEREVIVYPTGEDDAKLIMDSLKNSEYLKRTIVFRVPVKGISNAHFLDYFLREENINE